ncbi:MAG: cupin domain-containing protein [Thaumarchaeota archaeon]|nr:cupin domain-containing protein [Nitrososphaerota archaeon]
MKMEFDTNEYVKKIAGGKHYFHTFVNRETIAAGILRLAPGEKDTQSTHDSDEIYYVVRGDGFLKVGGKDYGISPGMAYLVTKNTEHKFHGNTTDLVVIYFFGGPDS